jgi:hypothetical protein
MTDINTRGKLPFTVVSSSVNTGYTAQLTAAVGQNIDIVNHHRDEYGQLENSPLQGPFTQQHVGGNQHRHINLNSSTDNGDSRAEGYFISASQNSIKIYGPDVVDINRPRAILTRDFTAKSPINIKNIQTSGNIAGNFEYNYQVIQNVGRGLNNNLIADGFEANGVLTTQFVSSSSQQIYSLPDITRIDAKGKEYQDKTTFVQRFNAPGGKQESSRGVLDRAGEEFSPNNSLTTRNIKVRQPYYNQLTQHAAQFNSGSTYALLPDSGSVNAVTIHGVNRNTLVKQRIQSTEINDQIYLTGSLAIDTNDYFGRSIALNSLGNILAVGSVEDESGSNGLSSGVVYIFTKNNSSWIEAARLTGSLATDANDNFGYSLAINSAGNILAIGAQNDESGSNGLSSGVVYIFTSGSSGWTENAIITGSLAIDGSELFSGRSIAMNSVGDILAVGAYQDESGSNGNNSGITYIFSSGSSGWIETARLTGSLATDTDDNFGYTVSLNSVGNTLAIAAYKDESGSNGLSSGVVYMFSSGSSGWIESSVLTGSYATDVDDQFGISLSLNSEGNILAVGAWADEYVPNDLFSGVVYIFSSGSSGWIETAALTGSLAHENDRFGTSVSLNSSGDILAVGARDDEVDPNASSSGVAYIFRSGSVGWTETLKITGSLAINAGDYFGFRVQLNSDASVFVVGAYQDEDAASAAGYNSGIVYVNELKQIQELNYSRHDNFWVQHSIPATDLRYKWIADSISSNQQPIEYQSFNHPYSTASFYNSNGAFTDLEFQLNSPFGDHLGISGAIDKDEVFVSTYTNTMYRDRKYLTFNGLSNTYVDLSNISSDILRKDFSISLWMKTSEYLNYDLSDSTYVGSYSYNSTDNQPEGLFFKSDGTRVYIVGNANNRIYQFDLSTPWDLTTTSSAGSFNISIQSTQPRGIYISPDGNSLYLISSFPNVAIYRYIITSWNITTAYLATFYAFNDDAGPRDLYFKPDGTKLYVVGDVNNKIYEKTLSDPWDLSSTGSATSKSITGSPNALHIGGAEGRRVIIFDKTTKSVYSYNLERPWDLTSDFNLINEYTLDVSAYEASGTGLFIRETNQEQQKLYIIGEHTDSIHEFNFNGNSPIPILQYSGSDFDHSLLLNVSPTGSSLFVSGSGITNTKKSQPFVNDGNWHLITLVTDLSSETLRIGSTKRVSTLNTVNNKIYIDAGLATEAKLYKNLNITNLFIPSKNNSPRYNYNLHDIIIWDKTLTEEQINELYRTSKSSYGMQPKKYSEHKLDNSKIPAPIHVYSSIIDKDTSQLIDEKGNKNVSIIAFTSSANITPENTGLVSYSTYFNGPYQAASWKSIRNSQHPITRKLTTENTNIISFNLNDKYDTSFRFKEPPINLNNKPLKHRIVLKNSRNPNSGLEIIHTYENNIERFSNKEIETILGLQTLNQPFQMYDVLYRNYTNFLESTDNPIQRLLGYSYNETIFPNSKFTGLKQFRKRTDYITDQPGYSIDGYDRQLGTQRAFWRDQQQNRMRTSKSYINSIGETVDSQYELPFQTPSISALELIEDTNNISYDNYISGSSISSSLIDTAFKNGAELNNKLIFTSVSWNSSSNQYLFEQHPVWSLPERYFFNSISTTSRENLNVVLKNNLSYPGVNIRDPSALAVSPKYVYEHSSIITCSMNETQNHILKSSSIDLGLNRYTEKLSGINPWYDSYEDFYEDVRLMSNDYLGSYSVIPEFNISNKIPSLIKENNGNERKINLDNFVNNIEFSLRDQIQDQNRELTKLDNITFKIKAVKKLLPYNGFYPQDYSIKLVNYLKDSYLDTDSVKGGFLLQTGSNIIDGLFYHTSSDGYLQKFSKESAFLEPLYSPGIFYNLIKSGIAVDWAVYTGSLPINNYFTNLNQKPSYRIPFETILDVFRGLPVSSSEKGEENRIMKSREINLESDAADFGKSAGNKYKFQSFFELENNSNSIYSLAINNFLAETINFFLKESKLTAFFSRPETEFLTLDASKTYYMNVVLRNKSITMADSYSSSLDDNYGKMKGMYFGPAFWSGSNTDLTSINNNLSMHKVLEDPAYAAYTPPYFYGNAIATISFKPYDGSRKYTLDEILPNLTMTFSNTGLINSSKYPSGSLYNEVAMPLSSSVELMGTKQFRIQTVDLRSASTLSNNFLGGFLSQQGSGFSNGTATNAGNPLQWVISTKMETPILDFSDSTYVSATDVLSASAADLELKEISSSHIIPTGSGFGIGMWSGYGKIPTNKGIYLELAETYPERIKSLTVSSKTGSLLQACGFNKSVLSRRIGEIADTKEISEALVIIPYSEKSVPEQRIVYYRGEDPQTLFANGTTLIENHNFFKIDENMFTIQRDNILQGKPAVDLRYYLDTDGSIIDTSISRMIKLMNKYVIPPNLNFILYNDIKPFVMYITEFKSVLEQKDLSNIWQGVMPKIATRAEREEQIITHKNSLFDFFHGQGLPSNIKFLMFKVKRRAEIDYFKMTANSKDDSLFPEIVTGKTVAPYSFNWPYDYFSLVETAKVDVELEYVSGSINT